MAYTNNIFQLLSVSEVSRKRSENNVNVARNVSNSKYTKYIMLTMMHNLILADSVD